MIPRRILLTVMTILLLLSPFAYSKPDSTGTRNDTVAIEVLEERVKGNAEKTQIQIDGIQNEMRVRTDALEHRMDVYVAVAVFLMGLLSWVGYKTVRGWARDHIEKMAGTIYEEGLADFKKRTAKLTEKLAEEAAKAEKQRRDIDRQAQELFEKVRTKTVDRDKPADAVDTGELSEYVEKLGETKTKDQYTAEDWFLLGYEAGERDDYEEAVRCYSKSIGLDPNDFWSHNNRGIALGNLERFEEALKDHNMAITLDPKNAKGYTNRGVTLGRLGRDDEALKDYDKAIELNPEYAQAHFNRGNTRGQMARHEEAVKDFNRGIELDPENANAYNNRGNSLSRLERYDEALMDYDKALELDPEHGLAYVNRGSTLTKLERCDEALVDYDKAIELDPKHTDAHFKRGSTLTKLERYDEALKSYDKALELDPDNISALVDATEVRILLGHYNDALEQASRALALSGSSDNRVISLYLKCIAERLLGKDTSTTEAEFEQILEEDFVVTWLFDEIEGWLEKAEISEDTREFIKAKTAKLKAKTKKE